jgi:uncharacterized peroxidase-related enzyme
MPHIDLPKDLPGIVGPMAAYPESAHYLRGLAEVVLRGPSSLSVAERELIAAYVSAGNQCHFCTQSHAAAARHLLGDQCQVVDAVLSGAAASAASPKLRALLEIAGKVRVDGRLVTPEDVAAARAAGADDRALHDTVLIAAMFCMYNRYVDGLATFTPRDAALYEEMGQRLATQGYVR